MRLRLGSSMTAAVAVVVAFAAPASAATLADWQMNEGAGATVMVDSSGHVNGTIGSAVQTGFKFNGATGYHWVFASPTAPPANPSASSRRTARPEPELRELHGHDPLQDDEALRQHRPEGPGRVIGWLLQAREPERPADVRLPGHQLVRELPAKAGRVGRPERRPVAYRPLRPDRERAHADRRRVRRGHRAGQLGQHHQQPPDLDRRQAELRPGSRRPATTSPATSTTSPSRTRASAHGSRDGRPSAPRGGLPSVVCGRYARGSGIRQRRPP